MQIKDNNSHEVEYIELRKEILLLTEIGFKVKMTVISVIGLLFAYMLSIEEPNPFCFLIPLPLIFYFYIIHSDLCYNIWKISSYCLVFDDSHNIKCERRLRRFRNHNIILNINGYNKKSLFMKNYIFYDTLSLISLFLFLFFIQNNFFFYLIISTIIFFILHYYFSNPSSFNLPRFPYTKERMIQAWEDIKKAEEHRS